MHENKILRQFARQLYLDGLLDLRSVRKLIKENKPLNDIDVQYFELLGHVIHNVNAAKLTQAKSRRDELRKLKQ